MKKLTFQNQINLGIVMLGIGHLLWYLTDIGFFVNLAFIFYGLMFAVHPEPPATAAHHPKIKIWLRCLGIAFILLGCLMKNGGEMPPWWGI